MCKAVEDFAEKRVEMRTNELRFEMARDMLVDDEPVEKIVKYTKLSMEKVLELKEQLVSA